MILEGDRVRLRPATVDDLPAYTRWWTDREFLYYMGPPGETFNTLLSPQANQINFSVETKEGRLAGLLFLTRINTHDRHCEIGLLGIGEPDCREQGYGREMTRLALRFCFRELGMHQVHIRTAEFNERARRCYGRIFPHEQRHRQWVWEDGRFWDEIYFDITEEEFDAYERG